jgi:hypothetical protein
MSSAPRAKTAGRDRCSRQIVSPTCLLSGQGARISSYMKRTVASRRGLRCQLLGDSAFLAALAVCCPNRQSAIVLSWPRAGAAEPSRTAATDGPLDRSSFVPLFYWQQRCSTERIDTDTHVRPRTRVAHLPPTRAKRLRSRTPLERRKVSGRGHTSTSLTRSTRGAHADREPRDAAPADRTAASRATSAAL